MLNKKAILVDAGEVELHSKGSTPDKFRKKALWVSDYRRGDLLCAADRIPGAFRTDPGDLKVVLAHKDLALVDLKPLPEAERSAAMEAILSETNRRTLLVLATKERVAFYGLGIDPRKGHVERDITDQDLIATVAYIADLPVPEECTGAVIYQALKDLDMKAKETRRLLDAIQRLETALQRDNREPWEKHDCA